MRRLTAVAAIVALGLAGCGEDSDEQTTTGAETTPTEPSGQPVAELTITEKEFSLDPASPTVAEEGVVEFRVENAGTIDHALEVEAPSGEVETESIPAGESATLKAELTAGEVTMYCPIGDHRERGMEGTVKVASGGGSAEPPPGGGGGSAQPPPGSGGGSTDPSPGVGGGSADPSPGGRDGSGRPSPEGGGSSGSDPTMPY